MATARLPPYFCCRCKVELNESNWSSLGTRTQRRWFICKICVAKDQHKRRARRKDKISIWKRNYYQRRKHIVLAEHKRYYLKHHDALKREVYEHYSNGTPKCACCGEAEYAFLSLDHINGGGGKDRKNGIYYWKWIIKNNFPPIFQVLCMNCNWGRRFTGVCPHKLVRKTTSEIIPLVYDTVS